MKKIILTTSIVFQFVFSFAQKEYEYVPFPTSNAIWSEVYYFGDNPNWQYPGYVYERFAVNGEDTLINGIVYTRIYMFLDTVFDKKTAKYIGALREDENKRIWLKVDTSLHISKPNTRYDKGEILLYDFSVNNEGDTITPLGYLNINMGWIVVVEKIDTIQIGDTYRKKIKIKRLDDFSVIEWIEGIGGNQGLFFAPWLVTPTCSCEKNYLIGFKHQDEILYFDDKYPSFYPTSIQAITNSNFGKIQIISTQNGLLFDCEDEDVAVIQIFNMLGVLQTTLQNEFILHTTNYASGIYIYRATDNSGKSYSGKFSIIKN